MYAGEQMQDNNGKQVCLFPLTGFVITQAWYESFSHDSSRYYATDFVAKDSNGNTVTRAPCYAPVDIELLWKDPVECCALWQSINQVHFADGSIDYLGIIVYHDNDIANGTYSAVGTVKHQGEIFNRTGTGGNVTGDHVHLETGKGQVNLAQYRYHFLDNTDCKRLVPDNALFINDTSPVTPKAQYNWVEYQGGIIPPSPTPIRRGKKINWMFRAKKFKTILT